MTIPAVFLNAVRRRTLQRGEVLFRAGDHGSEMFGVITGEVQLRHDDRIVERVRAGQTFGEMAIVDHEPRSLTASASEQTEIALIDRATFMFLVHETPLFALQVMASLSHRLRQVHPDREEPAGV